MRLREILQGSKFQAGFTTGINLFLLILLFLIQTSDGVPPKRDLVGAGSAVFVTVHPEDQFQAIVTPFSGQAIHQVWRDPNQDQRFYAATDSGLYLSEIHDRQWTKVIVPFASSEFPHEESNKPIYAVTRARGKLLVGTRDGLFESQDEGQTWQSISRGLMPGVIPLTIVVAMSDPDVIYLGTARHGVFRSQDGGESWQSTGRGLPPSVGAASITPVKHLVVDPTDHEIIYVATDVNGIYATRDGGRQWRAMNNGLPGVWPHRTYPSPLAVHPGNPRVIFTIMGYPVNSHRIETKLYMSWDRAEHWAYVTTLPENLIIHSLTFSVEHPDRLLIAHEEGVLTLEDAGSEISNPEFEIPDLTSNQLSAAAGSISQATPPNHLHTASQATPDFDAGNIAVLHDDRTLLHLFDLNGKSIQFEWLENDNYSASFIPFAFDSNPGSPLALGDNEFTSVNLPFSFQYYDRTYTSVFVNSNGNLTFNRGSRDRIPSIGFPPPRIAPFWTDLDPGRGGHMTVRSTADRFIVTWTNVPEVGTEALNTFQVILFNDSRIVISFGDVQSRFGLTGISQGLALLGSVVDFTQDLPLPRVSFRTAIYEFFNGAIEIDAVARRFYQTHPDEFDFLTVFGTSDTPYDVVGGAFAFYAPIKNDVAGIGHGQGEFNGGPAAFGSSGRLQGFINMNKLSEYPASPTQTFLGTNSTLDVMAQEVGHRWLAFVNFADAGMPSSALLGRDLAHWSFFMDTDASELEGNRWRDNGNGTFTSIEATSRYSVLDQYLIGLAPPEGVPPFFYIKNPTETNGRINSSPPDIGIRVTGTRQTVTVAQIIAEEGLRVPFFPVASNIFRQAFILVVPEGRQASREDLDKLETIRQSWEFFFRVITSGRGSIDTGLKSRTPNDPKSGTEVKQEEK